MTRNERTHRRYVCGSAGSACASGVTDTMISVLKTKDLRFLELKRLVRTAPVGTQDSLCKAQGARQVWSDLQGEQKLDTAEFYCTERAWAGHRLQSAVDHHGIAG